MKVEFSIASLPSINHPRENQDALFIDEKEKTAGVFDGVGGIVHGKEAANWCAQYFKRELRLKNFPQAFEDCHRFLKQKGVEAFNQEIATTATVVKLYLRKTTALVVWGSVGDSRIYHYSANSLIQISIDDSFITQALEKGWINSARAEKINQAESSKGLNLIEKNLFENRNIITQALGIGICYPRIGKFEAKNDDLIILTTDGVHDNLTNRKIEEILKQAPKNYAKALVEVTVKISESTSLRAKPDDMTAVVIKLFL